MKKLLLLFFISIIALAEAQWQETSFRTSMNSNSYVKKLYYDGKNLWAGSRSRVFKSADKGVTWEELTSGGITVNQTDVQDIIRLDEYIYVAFGGNGNKHIYRSKDEGKTWELDINGYTQSMHVIKFHTHKDYILGKLETNAVIYKKNSDSQWSTLAMPGNDYITPPVLFSKGDTLVVNSGQGVPSLALTVDMGKTWKTRPIYWGNGIPANGNWYVAVFQGRYNSHQIYGTNRGFVTTPRLEYVYNFVQTHDGMETFNLNAGFFKTGEFNTMWIHNDIVFVAYSNSVVWKSTDGGKTFTEITDNIKSFVPFLHIPIMSMEVIDDKLFVSGNQNGILVSSVVPTSVKTPSANRSSVFPTVVSDQLVVRPAMDNALVRVLSLEGKELITNKISTTEQTINLSTLPKGIYLVQIQSGESLESHRIIKQ